MIFDTRDRHPSLGLSGPAVTPDRPAGPSPVREMHVAGVLLLLAFFLPVRGPRRWGFPNIEEIPNADFTNLFILVFPLVAGAAVLALTRLRREGALRGGCLAALGLLPVGVILASPGFLDEVHFMLNQLTPLNQRESLLWVAAGLLGFVAQYAGLRGALLQPGKRVFRLLALGGAVLGFLLLFLPAHAPGVRSSGHRLSLPAVAVPFYMFSECRDFVEYLVIGGNAAGMIAYLLCLSFAVMLSARQGVAERRAWARRGFGALLLSYLLAFVPILLVVFFESGAEVFALLAALVKVFAWVIGWALLLPVGLVDVFCNGQGKVAPLSDGEASTPLDSASETPSPDSERRVDEPFS